MNRFYLCVIIFFWNKYIRRKWVQKAILWHLVTFFTQTVYCFWPLTLFSLWWICSQFCFLHRPSLPTLSRLLSFISQGFAPFTCMVIRAEWRFCTDTRYTSLPPRPLPLPSQSSRCQLCVTATVRMLIRGFWGGKVVSPTWGRRFRLGSLWFTTFPHQWAVPAPRCLALKPWGQGDINICHTQTQN